LAVTPGPLSLSVRKRYEKQAAV